MRPAILNPLFADVTTLQGVGPKLAALVTKAAGPRIVDLLMTAPVGLIDRRARPKIADAPFGALATVKVMIDRHDPPRLKRMPYKIICSDETGFLTLVFFHARADYLLKLLPEGSSRLISGRIEEYGGSRQMTHPDHIIDPANAAALPLIEPVYPLTSGLPASVMRKAAAAAVHRAPDLKEWLDPAWQRKQRWPDWRSAVHGMHQPESLEALSPQDSMRQRLAYDELLANQLALTLIRSARKKTAGRTIKGDGLRRAKIKNALSFELTNGQVAALNEIDADMQRPERMVRLLQGDVGSGKTIVALLAMMSAVETGAQAALMAPTEILARQHLASLSPLCSEAGVSVEVLTGRDKVDEKRIKLERLVAGKTQILIGTHSLFQEAVTFSDLALVVIDEQHRFGVHQRVALTDKGPRPDMLVMTATPIPRSLALTAYGDMEVSAIREKPPGRKPIDTRTIPIQRIEEVIVAVVRAADRGEQIYWVCPLVEETEALEVTAAETRFTALQDAFGARVGLVHGRLSPSEKDDAMRRFHRGDTSVLVATTVIEVGVDAPNATIMVIEHAERFGLAQLHQLRGRVGRGDRPSSCLLLYKGPLGETAKARLEILRKSEDGFLLAEEDLRLRGAGDVLGVAQSGFARFRLADPSAHADLLYAASDDARLIVERDPQLKSTRGEALRALLYLFSRDDAVKLIRSG